VADAVQPGTELGGYRLTGLIGRGGMGTVYLGEEVATGRRAAVKVLAASLAHDEGFRRRFVREARYARTVEHPNVVSVLDAGEAHDLLYIVMEYVEGTALETLLAVEGALAAERALRIVEQVADALDAVHAAGILHRDLKPGNVLVSPAQGRERAWLTDFGLSKSPSRDTRPLTAAGELVGTTQYMAPEQILAKDLDERVDVYGLGCLLFECLTGEPPFLRERAVDVLRAHVEEPPPSVTAVRPDLPFEIDAVLTRAMAKQPENRFETCRTLAAAAWSALGEVVAAAPERRATPPAP
jgi:serine/threonine protein kinase